MCLRRCCALLLIHSQSLPPYSFAASVTAGVTRVRRPGSVNHHPPPILYLTTGFHNHRRICLLCSFPVFLFNPIPRMTRNGMTSTKGPAPTAAGSTAGNLSQLLLRSYFRKVSKKNSS
ncbi:hypothetical protein PIB30_089355 [Stylosanthes scabra]|uniref:Secreted protein n=1 Tax=Stylosanthes scabra TaxID=79078 RepID=A0ABU6ZT79_9FABA|nr:hypothetical protein [Stylosanthes scabra]